MVTPKAPNLERIAKSEQNIIDLTAKASERGSYAEQVAKHSAKSHPSIRTTEDKIVIGMNAIGAALFIADGIRRFANGEKSIDENGNATIKPSAMIVPALQILLGVGCAYMAHTHYSATSAATIPVAR